MDEREIRLECLKLAHVAARPAAEVVMRAQEYERYVKEAEPSRRRAKKSDNLASLLTE